MLGFGAFASGAALLPMTIAIMALMVGIVPRLVASAVIAARPSAEPTW